MLIYNDGNKLPEYYIFPVTGLTQFSSDAMRFYSLNNNVNRLTYRPYNPATTKASSMPETSTASRINLHRGLACETFPAIGLLPQTNEVSSLQRNLFPAIRYHPYLNYPQVKQNFIYFNNGRNGYQPRAHPLTSVIRPCPIFKTSILPQVNNCLNK